MKKIALIDNYDSFSYNLVHAFEHLGHEVTIWRNDAFELEDLVGFDKIVLSPGPGIPSEAGKLQDVIRKYAPTKSILGVCLGHQAIAEVFGGSLQNLNEVFHGKASNITVVAADEALFAGLPHDFAVGRYHSWSVSTASVPETLIMTSIDTDGQIMSLKHRDYDVRGIQFHPESILTPNGLQILKNWIDHERPLK